MLQCSVYSMATEVTLKQHYILFSMIGREVALYVKEKFIAELQKLNSFKNRDYATALKEVFIKMDDILKTPQAIKDIKKYSGGED